ncbi:MAG: hypothetical protein K8F91_25840 [Candidatus Obscuribacterales bacterium]|nr:hypothetical protein [Candidatus Obscuribacterales bacterium]
MPNQYSNDDIDLEALEDALDDARLNEAKQNKEFKKARQENTSLFTSFSDGLKAVDKLAILGLDDKAAEKNAYDKISAGNEHQKQTKEKSDSFVSFSDGLSAVEKFEITDDQIPDLEKKPALLKEKNWSLSSFFNLPISPFSEMAMGSSAAPSGQDKNPQPASGLTLDALILRLSLCPWLDEITVRPISEEDSSHEYCFMDHCINLDFGQSKERQILAFSHQLYHSAHRALVKLYRDGPLDEETFIDTFCWSETAALITEMNVRRELNLKTTPEVSIEARKKDGSLARFDIEKVLARKGLQTLRALSRKSLLRGSKDHLLADFLVECFQYYRSSFASKQRTALAYIDKGKESGLPASKI